MNTSHMNTSSYLNTSKGKKAENIAKQFFVAKGYQIIAQNYRYQKAEIDLIIAQEQLLIFVEVKYRSSDGFGLPEEAVSESQKNRIISAAEQFIIDKNWLGDIRFDILAILQSNHLEITHFEDAFY